MNQVFFEEVNNKRVFCLLAEGTSRKIVIMSHGFRGTNVGPVRQFVDFEKVLVGKGYSVFRFDQPNSGNSEGDYIDTSFKEWINTIVHFAKKYLDLGYEVNLLGQSMGATATVAATNSPEIKDKISTILLWVPDPETIVETDADKIYEEGGQKYNGNFWHEAQDADFFKCLNEYTGKIHLVYGETDRYVSQELMDQTLQIVKNKKQTIMILKGQDHSPWAYDIVQKVYQEELAKLLE